MAVTRMLAACAIGLTLCLPAHAASEVAYFPPTQAQSFIACQSASNKEQREPFDDFEISWFSKHLSAAHEPSLYQQSIAPSDTDSASSYRFTWLRSFHASVTVRIDETGGKMLLIAKRLTGHGGYDPGRIGETMRRELTQAEGEKVRGMLNPAETTRFQCVMGLDGAEWVVETRIGNSYHYAAQWSPDTGPVRAFGLFLLGLTGWKLEPIY